MQKRNKIGGIDLVLGVTAGLLGVLPSFAHAQKASALAEADLIRETWPGVIVHFPFEEPWGGAELVCGEPMTTRATAREALEGWLFEHGSVSGPTRSASR